MNKPWVFAQLVQEDLLYLLCGLEKPVTEDTVDADEGDEDTRLVAIRVTSRARRSWSCFKT